MEKVTTEASGNPSSPNPSSPAQDEDEGEDEERELDSPENDKARIEDSFLPREQAALSDKAPGKSMKYYGRAGTKQDRRALREEARQEAQVRLARKEPGRASDVNKRLYTVCKHDPFMNGARRGRHRKQTVNKHKRSRLQTEFMRKM